MAMAGEDWLVPTEARWPEWPDCVREAGDGEAAFYGLVLCQ